MPDKVKVPDPALVKDPAPDIIPETDVEIRRYKEGKNRTLERKKELIDK